MAHGSCIGTKSPTRTPSILLDCLSSHLLNVQMRWSLGPLGFSKNIILPTTFISVRNQSHMLLPTPGHWLEKQEKRERSADALH